MELAIERGWLIMHESGTFVRFTPAGAELSLEPTNIRNTKLFPCEFGNLFRIVNAESFDFFRLDLAFPEEPIDRNRAFIFTLHHIDLVDRPAASMFASDDRANRVVAASPCPRPKGDPTTKNSVLRRKKPPPQLLAARAS